MFSHLSTHMISKNFTIHTKSFTAYTAIEFKVYVLVFIAMSEFLWFLSNLDSLMLGCEFTCMIILITFHTEMGIFSYTKKFSCFRRNLGAILAKRCSWLLFFIGINNIINHINRKDLIILRNNILMPENLGVLIFAIKIDWFETLRTANRVIHELWFTIAIWFSHWNLVHYATDLLLGVSDLMETNIEYHTWFWKFITFLAYFEQFVILIELLCGEERLQNNASFGVTAECRT